MTDRQKILIVDDQTDFLDLAGYMLSHSGYEVLSAQNAQEGFDLACQERPDLVLMDVMMPGKSGMDAAAMFLADPRTRDIPLVFLTCLLSDEHFGEDNRIVVSGRSYPAIPKNNGTSVLVDGVREQFVMIRKRRRTGIRGVMMLLADVLRKSGLKRGHI